MSIRTSDVVAHEQMVARTLVRAFRAVFTSDYYEDQFADLHVVPEFPLKEAQYPALVISYNANSVLNAGVGHREFFKDDDNQWRHWLHRRFSGSISMTAIGMTPLDRDILADAVMEILSFGQLDELLEEFYDVIYGENDIGDPELTLPVSRTPPVEAFLSQLYLNTDEIKHAGKGADPTPWDSEDAYLHSCTYVIECGGGFYNRYRHLPYYDLIRSAKIVATDEDEFWEVNDDDGEWIVPYVYRDAAVVRISLLEPEYPHDTATVKIRVRPSGSDGRTTADAARLRIRSSFHSWDQRVVTDVAVVHVTPSFSGVDTLWGTSPATLTITPVIGGSDTRTYPADVATLTIRPVIYSLTFDAAVATVLVTTAPIAFPNYGWMVDAALATMSVSISGTNVRNQVDAAVVPVHVTVTGTNERDYGINVTVDDAIVSITVTPATTDQESTYGVPISVTISGSDVYSPSWLSVAYVYATWAQVTTARPTWADLKEQ